MKITNIKIQHIKSPKNKLRAFATITIDNSLVITDFQIFDSVKGLFVNMPNKKMPDGSWKDTVFSIDADFDSYIKNTILRAYEDECAMMSF